VKPWLKAWRKESPRFRSLPLASRALALYVLKFVDESGCLPMGRRDVYTAVAVAVGADVGERRWLRPAVAALLEHGYLREDGEALVVSNFPRYQDDGTPTPTRRERDASRTRVERESDVNATRVEPEPDASSDLSTRKPSLARPVLSSEKEERLKIEEGRGEIPPPPVLVPDTRGVDAFSRSMQPKGEVYDRVVELVSDTRVAAGGFRFVPSGHIDVDAIHRLVTWASKLPEPETSLRAALVAFWAAKGTGASLTWLASEDPGRMLGKRAGPKPKGHGLATPNAVFAEEAKRHGIEGRGSVHVKI
jgi:hypothetical protein